MSSELNQKTTTKVGSYGGSIDVTMFGSLQPCGPVLGMEGGCYRSAFLMPVLADIAPNFGKGVVTLKIEVYHPKICF